MGYILMAIGASLVISFSWFHYSAPKKKGINIILIVVGVAFAVSGFVIQYNQDHALDDKQISSLHKRALKDSSSESSSSEAVVKEGDFTQEDVLYVEEMMKTSEKLLANFNEFANLMQAEDLGSERWENQLNGNLNLRKEYIREFKEKDLKPNALKHSDEYLMQAFDKYYKVAEEFPDAVKNRDVDKINELVTITDEATALLIKAGDEVTLVTNNQKAKVTEVD